MSGEIGDAEPGGSAALWCGGGPSDRRTEKRDTLFSALEGRRRW